jgi:hypothetical protein
MADTRDFLKAVISPQPASPVINSAIDLVADNLPGIGKALGGIFGGGSQAAADEPVTTGGINPNPSPTGTQNTGSPAGQPAPKGEGFDLMKSLGGVYNTVWGDRDPNQRLLIMGALGRLAAGTADKGAGSGGRNSLDFAAAFGGAGEQLNKEKEAAAKRASEEKIAKINSDTRIATQKDVDYNAYRNLYLGLKNNADFVSNDKLLAAAKPQMLAEGMSEKAIDQLVASNPERVKYYYIKSQVPEKYQGYLTSDYPSIAGKAGGGSTAMAQPKAGGDIQTDKSGVKWEIIKDASGKPIGKRRA